MREWEKYTTTDDMKIGYLVKVTDEIETFWATVKYRSGMLIEGQIKNNELRIPYDKDRIFIYPQHVEEIRKPTEINFLTQKSQNFFESIFT